MRAVPGLVVLMVAAAACGDDTPMSGMDMRVSSCETSSDCDDGLFCNGVESCDPSDPAANDTGCVAGSLPCPRDECAEDTASCLGECDADGDGIDSIACGGNDCDDLDPDRYPGNAEVCDVDGVDEDCDPCTVGERDVDVDFFVDANCFNALEGSASCGPGVVTEDGVVRGLDCDDANAAIKPGESESCNRIDDDCDGSADEGLDLGEFWPDGDSDGFGETGGSSVMACSRPAGTADNDFDCDDTEATTSPVSAETCDGVDNDCDEDIDEGGMNTYCQDVDDDGFGNPGVMMETSECVPPDGYSPSCGDCDDTDPLVFPGAAERCNRIDDDCDGTSALAEDQDDDGQAPVGAACEGGLPKTDCDDTRSWVYDGAPEFCSAIDEDCDGTTNEDSDDDCATGTCAMGCAAEEALALADDTGCAIGTGGAYCWGNQDDKFSGEGNAIGTSGPDIAVTPMLVNGTTGADNVSVDPLDNNACARLADGRVLCWGVNFNGELGTGDDTARAGATQIPGLGNGSQVVAGQGLACARTDEGRVWCWGLRSEGRLGIGVPADSTGIAAPTELDLVGIVELANGGRTTCARAYDGQVSCWGGAYAGDGSIGAVTSPIPITLPGPAVRLRGGGYQGSDATLAMCAQVGSDWYCWGANEAGVGDGTTTPRALPRRVTAFGTTPTTMAPHWNIQCALESGGAVSCIGVESDARLGTPFESNDSITTAVPIDVTGATDVVCGGGLCCAELSDRYRCWGIPASPIHGDGLLRDGTTPEPLADLSAVTKVVVAPDGGCALAGGELRCWGGGDDGRLGNGRTEDAWMPVSVSLPTTVSDFDVFMERGCAVLDDGAVYCWGRGAPGDGSASGEAGPRLVDATAMGTATTVATGCSQSCALDAAGAAWCWGNDDCGGTDPLCMGGACLTPALVPGGHAFSSLSVGFDHACGIDGSGDVWCWGSNFYGELGSGSAGGSVTTPVQMMGASGIDEVALGQGFGCVRDGGRVRCIGSGSDGELGDGASSDSATLVTAIGSGASSLRCGRFQCVARVGSDWQGWGDNNGRSLDPSNGSDIVSPRVLPTLSSWTSVAPGPPLSCGVLADGTAECLGGRNRSPARRRVELGLPAYSDLVIP